MVRGEIFRLRHPASRAREQAGARYGVVVQADELLALGTVLIAPELHALDAALEDVLGL